MTELFNSKSCNYTFSNGFSDTAPFNARALTFDSDLTDVGSITVQLSKTSGYTGTIKGAIWDTDGTLLQSTATINASVLDTNNGSIGSYQEHTFTFSTHTLTSGQYIGLSFSDYDDPDFLYIARSNSANTCSSPSGQDHTSDDGGSTWGSGNDYLIGIVIDSGSPTPPPSSSTTLLPPPPAMVRL